MKTDDLATMQEWLRDHNHFSECIIEEMRLNDYGTTLELLLNYIWANGRTLRSKLDEPELITLRFSLVQEIHIINALTPAMVAGPEQLNWGINEVALVEINADGLATQYNALPKPFYRCTFKWEGMQRRIDLVFWQLELVSRARPDYP